jgi:hypothetical protein
VDYARRWEGHAMGLGPMSTPAQREAAVRVLYEGITGNPWDAAKILGDDRERYYRHVDELIAVCEAAANAPTHRHRKGGLYRLIGYAHHTEEVAVVAVYADSDGVLWARPAEMFDDGRFQPVDAPPKDTAP